MVLTCSLCPAQYTRSSDGSLTDRWLSPISLVLYFIIFSKDPREDVPRAIENIRQNHSAELLSNIVSDIRRELDEPKQRVRDILNLMAPEELVSEADVREFLGLVADGLG